MGLIDWIDWIDEIERLIERDYRGNNNQIIHQTPKAALVAELVFGLIDSGLVCFQSLVGLILISAQFALFILEADCSRQNGNQRMN